MSNELFRPFLRGKGFRYMVRGYTVQGKQNDKDNILHGYLSFFAYTKARLSIHLFVH